MNASFLTIARWHLLNHGKVPWSPEVSRELVELIGDKLGYPAPGTPDHDLVPIAPLPASDSRQKIALCLGHGRAIDEGNVGYGGVSEEEYNEPLIEKVAARLGAMGIDVVTVTFYQGGGYESAMRWLAAHLLKIEATAAVEFHFNASEEHKARGHEVLHWESSKRGVGLAGCLNTALDIKFPDHPRRGLKPKSARDRGALFLSLTHCPAAIVEPFFGDNAIEWRRFDDPDESDLLADAYAEGIAAWVATQE